MKKNNKKLPKNNLPELYDALQSGDTKEVKKIAAKLTPSEESVASAYLYKNEGKAADALENELEKDGEGIIKEEQNKLTIFILCLRIAFLFAIFIVVLFIELSIKKAYFSHSELDLLKGSLFDYIISGIAGLIISLVVDDLVFN